MFWKFLYLKLSIEMSQQRWVWSSASLSSEIIGPGQGVVALAHQATLVDLVGSSLTSVFSQKSASILPWTRLSTFGGDSNHFLNSLLTSRARNTHCCILFPVIRRFFCLSWKFVTRVSVTCAPFVQVVSHLKPLQSEQRRHNWHSEYVPYLSSSQRSSFDFGSPLIFEFWRFVDLIIVVCREWTGHQVLSVLTDLSFRFSRFYLNQEPELSKRIRKRKRKVSFSTRWIMSYDMYKLAGT